MIYFTVGSGFDGAALDGSSVLIFILFMKTEYRTYIIMNHLRTWLRVHTGSEVNVRQIARQLHELTKKLRSWLGSDQNITELLRTASQQDKHDTCKEFDHRLKSTHSNDKAGGKGRDCDTQYIPSEDPSQVEAATHMTDEQIMAV